MLDIQIGPITLNKEDRIAFFRTLGSWLAAGAGQTAVNEAVRNTCEAFSYDEYKTLRPKMEAVEREYTGGQTPLHEALRNADLGFEQHELAVIQAAEESNQLREAVPALVKALDISFKGRKLLVGSLTMPLAVGFALIVLSLGVLIIMLPMVIGPVIQRNPEALGEFPAILRYYWYASVWLRANTIPVSIVGSIPVLVFIFQRVPVVKAQLDKMVMAFKPTRRLVYSFNSVLIVYFLPAFARSGMPGHQVLDALAGCVAHPLFSGLLRGAAEAHRTGTRMGEAVRSLPLRTSFANAVSTGEQTGSLADRVADLQEPYSVEMERIIRQTVGTLKFIVMAVLLPFFIVSAYTSLVGPIFALMEY